MSPSRRCRSTAPSRSQVWLAIAAATVLLVAAASDAFVTASPPKAVLGQPTTASRSTATPNVRTSSGQADAIVRAGAATALICLALASRATSTKTRAPRVRCTAVLSPSSTCTATVHIPPPSAPGAAVAQQVTLLDFDAEEPAIPAIVVPVIPSAPAVTVAPSSAPGITAAPAETAVPRARRAHRARLAGGARTCSPRTTRSARAATATTSQARRSVGKRLQQRAQPVPVAAPSFDPSTVRQCVQIGLRISSTLRSEKGRECKSTSSLEGSDMSTGLRIQANAFGE
mmetsp:Transcript_23448/g.44149  ORF Transcript_23448/g.44149 Transcript_23448/m.44149 type:complete len:286 (-) Transcript_23448:164-1021(-)